MKMIEPPSPKNMYHANHIQLLCDSFKRLTNKTLIEPCNNWEQTARCLFEAPVALLSHNTLTDPTFTYANQTALSLFELSWEELIAMPSRKSAEPLNREERARLLEEVTLNGYIDHYQGVRISKNGRRFLIKNAVVWNLVDTHGIYRGQAATFKDWTFL